MANSKLQYVPPSQVFPLTVVHRWIYISAKWVWWRGQYNLLILYNMRNCHYPSIWRLQFSVNVDLNLPDLYSIKLQYTIHFYSDDCFRIETSATFIWPRVVFRTTNTHWADCISSLIQLYVTPTLRPFTMEQIYRFPAAGRGLSRREKNDEGQEKDLCRP